MYICIHIYIYIFICINIYIHICITKGKRPHFAPCWAFGALKRSPQKNTLLFGTKKLGLKPPLLSQCWAMLSLSELMLGPLVRHEGDVGPLLDQNFRARNYMLVRSTKMCFELAMLGFGGIPKAYNNNEDCYSPPQVLLSEVGPQKYDKKGPTKPCCKQTWSPK